MSAPKNVDLVPFAVFDDPQIDIADMGGQADFDFDNIYELNSDSGFGGL